MAFVDTLVNGFGGQWFDMKWNATIDSKPWHDALNYYVDLLHRDGPPGVTGNGFNENLALFTTGHCAMWVDATSAAGLVYDKSSSQVWDKTGFTAAPHGVTANGTGWFWAWAMAVPTTSKNQDAAKSFLAWSTSKEYIELVGQTFGYTVLPPGTRISTYSNPNYIKAAPFAETVKASVLTADITKPSMNPVPYVGIQYVAIPEFQAMGTEVGQLVSSALAGQTTVDAALKKAQASVSATIEQAGYK